MKNWFGQRLIYFANFTVLKRILYISLFLFFMVQGRSVAQSKIVQQDGGSTAKLIKFYPNPTSTLISFEFTRIADNSYGLQIYNFMGKKVYDVKKVPSRITINLEDFSRGIYIFQLRDKYGTIIQSGKFQVVKWKCTIFLLFNVNLTVFLSLASCLNPLFAFVHLHTF